MALILPHVEVAAGEVHSTCGSRAAAFVGIVEPAESLQKAAAKFPELQSQPGQFKEGRR